MTTTETARTPYVIVPEPPRRNSRMICNLCGAETGKFLSVFNVFTDAEGEEYFACDDCALAGPDELRGRILAQIGRVESKAARDIDWLREAAQRLAPADRTEHRRLVAENDAFWEAEGRHRPGEAPPPLDPDECPF